MEKKLKMLFDFQRFENNKALAELIAETENRYAVGLSEEDLALINAAGEKHFGQGKNGNPTQ